MSENTTNLSRPERDVIESTTEITNAVFIATPVDACGEIQTLNEYNVIDITNTSDSQQSSQQLLQLKAATLQLLDTLSGDSGPTESFAPESVIASEKPDQGTLTSKESSSTVDLTRSESAEVVTITDSSSENNSRSSFRNNEEEFGKVVELTHESDSNNSLVFQESTEIWKTVVEDSLETEPPAKRSRTDNENLGVVENNLSEDVVITGTEEAPSNSDQFDSGDVVCHVRKSVFEFKGAPKQITGAWEVYNDLNNKNYLRGCKWAPDGTCLLTNSNDNKLRIFNLPDELYYEGGENKIIPEMNPVVQMKEADTIYDYSWYPLMSSSQPETACLAVTSKDTPIHLYDAFTGELRCSYRAYNHVDEVVAAHCVEFSRDGSSLYCGFNKMIRVFDVTRPGREFENRPTFAKDGQRGIISCIDCSMAEPGLYAAGSYSRSIALYQEPAGSMVCMFEGQQGGVTQVKFSPDGTKLYSGGRKDNEILCWDLRNPGQILFSLLRSVITNQRIYFDITSDSRYLVSGSSNGSVLVWDTTSPPVQHSELQDPVVKPLLSFEAHSDCVNGISLHPSLPVVATASGQRHFEVVDSEEDSQDSLRLDGVDNSLRLWWI